MARRFVSDLGSAGKYRSGLFWLRRSNCGRIGMGICICRSNCRTAPGRLRRGCGTPAMPIIASFEDGDLVHVEGTTQIYQGGLQLIATSICRARPDEVDLADFMCLSPADIDRLALRLAELLRSMQDLPLRNLAECFLTDEDFMQRLARSPAGIKNHHAYPGGLLEHVVNLMEVAEQRRRALSDFESRSAADGRVPARHGQGRGAFERSWFRLHRCRPAVGARGAGDLDARQQNLRRPRNWPASRCRRKPCCG